MSTIDAIIAACLLAEKCREKHRIFHAGCLDLEKAFERVSNEVIWWALRAYSVTEKCIDWIKLIYQDVDVWYSIGVTNGLLIKVGMHQGSVLSPVLSHHGDGY